MITGYSDKLSVRPNEVISFMVSTDASTFDLSFVNLKCGDPELLETIIPMPSSGEYQGRNQELQIGSYCSVEGWDSQSLTGDFTIGVWIFPTLKKIENQPVLSDRDVDGNGFEIGLTKNGKPYFMLGKIRVVSKVTF
jgi:N,N-dimethylformamidase